ncbi:hypothetical protein KI387_038974 [Taxus chinensis]|uniref:Serine-threonine/tyrosine-protein kinase catalytic domain-containing protein n=1 Tax=Taxus chinensis TaxID=29808 RepID=A0AA38C6B4_TAXCH|nr:hypothetical protein KI387_038974 [Taxus chinensis]
MEREQSHLSTMMLGMPRYLALEWLLNTRISSKSDVYSFGMVLFELISGWKNMDVSVEDEEKRHYPSWAWRVVEDQKSNGEVARELVDPILQGEYDLKEVEVLLNVAFMCIQAYASTRPTMGLSFLNLNNVRVVTFGETEDTFRQEDESLNLFKWRSAHENYHYNIESDL